MAVQVGYIGTYCKKQLGKFWQVALDLCMCHGYYVTKLNMAISIKWLIGILGEGRCTVTLQEVSYISIVMLC